MLNVKNCLQYIWISHRRCNKFQIFTNAPISLLLSRPAHLSHSVFVNAEVRDLLKDNLLGSQSEQTASFPPLLGSYFWGLSSGSFKRRLVTAGTSWTKLLLPAPLLLCSHSTLIGFDGICLIPQWKNEKGTWRCCCETEVWPFVQKWWHFVKKTTNKQKKHRNKQKILIKQAKN